VAEVTPFPESAVPVTHSSKTFSEPIQYVPQAPILDKTTYASPMSYVGSGRRTTAWIRKVGKTPVAASLAWSVGVVWIAAMWLVVLPVYYFFTLIIFGWLMIPFRLVRRSHRKQEHLQKAQLATMQAMMVQQQQALMQNQQHR
jgi:hypothetical protein